MQKCRIVQGVQRDFVCKKFIEHECYLGYIIICEIIYIDNKHVFSPN